MAGMGKFNASDLNKFKAELEKMERNSNEFIEACAKELAARLLAMVIKRTPVGDYSGQAYECASGKSHKGNKVKGKVGGTLRPGLDYRKALIGERVCTGHEGESLW